MAIIQPYNTAAPDYGSDEMILQAHLSEGEMWTIPSVTAARSASARTDWLISKQALLNILDRLLVTKDSSVSEESRPAVSPNGEATMLFWSKSFCDLFKSTDLAQGYHPMKMVGSSHVPDITAHINTSEACLRVYVSPSSCWPSPLLCNERYQRRSLVSQQLLE